MDEKNYTLVVVDMQPLCAAQKTSIEHVRREVRDARLQSNPILFLWTLYMSPLQEQPSDPIYQEILKELTDYDSDLWEQIGNITEDTTVHVLYICREKKFTIKRFRICSVTTDLAMLDTAKGLLNSTSAIIEVVKDTSQLTYSDNNHFWSKYPKNNKRLILLEPAPAPLPPSHNLPQAMLQ